MFVDSHAHLFSKDFQDDRDDVIRRAKDAGIDYIITPGTDLETSTESIVLAEQYDMIFACVGFHPHDASKANDRALLEIEKLSRHPKVVAIGEIGLDYHYNFSSPERQREVFAQQIDIAIQRDLPIVIHSREAEDDTLKIVEEKVTANPLWRSRIRRKFDRYPPPRGVFHCFPGDVAMARKVIDWGFYISIPGPVTFASKPSKQNSMVEVVSKISPEHILLETDSPYLAPAPHRGKRNEPSNIPLIAQKISELQELSVEDIARTSSFGVHKLFGIGAYPDPVFAYKLRDSLYLNITIRCNADCVFCDRKGEAIIKGHNLRIEKEPTADEVIRAIGDPAKFQEIVFCGYGEPTIRLDVLKDVSRWIKSHGGKVRLNTDGHGNIINHKNIVPELVGLIDAISISLNSTDPNQYGELMRVDGKTMFPAMIEFTKECVRNQFDVTMTTVDLDIANETLARRFVEQEIGAKFRNRVYF